MFKNLIKEKLKNGETVLGSFFNSYSPDIAEMMGTAGLDFIVIDCEHGPGSPESIVNCIRAAEATGMTPIARVTEGSRTTILRFLDVGAHGILVPQLESVEQAKQVVQYSKYAPEGIRGMAVPRAAVWGFANDYTRVENEETLICVQCENVACLECVEDVAKVPGIDVIFLGPYDMSQALGVPGQIKHPLMLDAEKRILKAAQDAGKIPGIYVNTPEDAIKAREEGWKLILMTMDIQRLGKAFMQDVATFRG